MNIWREAYERGEPWAVACLESLDDGASDIAAGRGM